MKLIEAARLEFEYRDRRGRPVYRLGPISLHIESGEFVGIAGKNGVGKSSLFLLLSRLLWPKRGEVSWATENLRIGFAFQSFARSLLPWKTVRDNVGFGARGARSDELDLLAGAEISQDSYPYQLSGGQQQIVSIVRAFSMGLDAVFLDEPFSSLDYDNTLKLARGLKEMKKGLGRAVLLVVHTLELQVLLSDRLLVIGGNPCRIQAEWVRPPVPSEIEEDWEALQAFASAQAADVRAQYDEFI
ncbi:MAG: ATP-binding cassette domain-containing protein [bacterium]|nr:ATP-binding cassette domain-containing protein [bacterium]